MYDDENITQNDDDNQSAESVQTDSENGDPVQSGDINQYATIEIDSDTVDLLVYGSLFHSFVLACILGLLVFLAFVKGINN